MQSVNSFPKQWRLIAASIVAAAIVLITLATGMTAWAQSNPQRAAVTGLSATPGANPGQIDVSWDAHPAGAIEYRVAWAPDGESFRGASNTDWNANPTATSMTIAGLTGGSDYKVKVRARFSSNPKSRWSSVETATATAPPSPPPPVIQPSEPLETAEGHSTGNLPWVGHDPQDIQDRQKGELASSGDEDWYRLPSLAANGVYKLSYTLGYDGSTPLPSVSEPKLTVYDASGDVVMKHGHPVAAERIPRSESYWNVYDGHKSGPAGYLDPYLFFIPETSGTYYLKVSSVIDDTGHYDLWYYNINTENKGDRTGSDCSDSIDTECRISSSTGITAAKFHAADNCPPGDRCSTRWDDDTWWVYLEYGLTYNLCINSPGSNDGFSSPDGLFEHARVGGDGRACTTATPQFRTKGYEVKVGGRGLVVDGSETRDYIIYARTGSLNSLPVGTRLSSSEPAGGDLREDANTTGYVQPNGEPATGNISTLGDEDWFLVDMVAGHRYRIDVKGSAVGDPGGTLDDPYLRLGGTGSISINVINDSGGSGQNPRIVHNATITGTYKLEIFEQGDDATGTYTVIVKRTN